MSPLKHAGDIRGPVLIAEGEFGIEEGLAMSADLISAVKKNGIPAELIKYPNEGDSLMATSTTEWSSSGASRRSSPRTWRAAPLILRSD